MCIRDRTQDHADLKKVAVVYAKEVRDQAGEALEAEGGGDNAEERVAGERQALRRVGYPSEPALSPLFQSAPLLIHRQGR